MGSLEKRLMYSPVLPALAALWLLASAAPFAAGNTVPLVLLLVCGLWLTATFGRLSRVRSFTTWLAGGDPDALKLPGKRR